MSPVNRKLPVSEKTYAGTVLARLAEKYGFSSDSAIGEHLGITRQSVSNWRTRDTLDYKLLLDKFPDADLNWLFRGEALKASGTVEDALDILKAKGYRVTLE